MRKVKVIDIIQAYEADNEFLEMERKQHIRNTNRTKIVQRNNLMLQFLKTVPETLYISAEGTPTDNAKINAGSLTECIVKYHLAKSPLKEVEKSGGLYDTKRGCIDVEIKLSVNGSCYNTPIADPMLIYLVNREGVFMVRKHEIDEVAPKGKLPYTGWDGATHIKSLEKALGYIQEVEE